MLHNSRTLAGALVLTFLASTSFVACVSADPTAPPDVVAPSHSGVCGDAWTPVASMAESRYQATVTSLLDGRVVVAGGTWADGLGGGGTRNSAERYDGTTNTWSSAGTLNLERYWHGAVRLNDGRVLVAGGRSDSSVTNTTEIYNPATNTWSNAASMNDARWTHALTRLSDGRVLASGGKGNGDAPLNTAEIYNPGTNTWTRTTGNMTSTRSTAGAVLLSDGRVLVAGGSKPNPDPDGAPIKLSSAEIFNPATGTWTATTNPMSVTRYAFGMAALQDGRVVAAGGTATPDYPGAEIFNPATGTWSPTGDMGYVPRAFFATLPMADGRIMVVGGSGDGVNTGGYLASVEMFDIGLGTNGQWAAPNDMSISRIQPAVAELPDGRILVAGGYTSPSVDEAFSVATAETYLPCPPNLRPVAVCKASPYVISAGPTCSGASVNVDNGSYDPDNGPGALTVYQDNLGPYSLGDTTVTLIVDDTKLSNTCQTVVRVADTTGPTVTCPDDDPNVPGNQRYLECNNGNGGAFGTFTATATDNCSGTVTATCSPSSATLPLGSTNVPCTARDGAGNTGACNIQAIVRDTQPPATNGSKGMTLWPADGTMREVTLMDCAQFAVDACRGRLLPLKDYGIITKVTSDEPEDAQGGSDGATTGDIFVKKNFLALLRAERNANGNGRVYTIHYFAKDPDGNTASGSCQVGVPKTQSSTPVDDTGAGYCFDNPNEPLPPLANIDRCP